MIHLLNYPVQHRRKSIYSHMVQVVYNVLMSDSVVGKETRLGKWYSNNPVVEFNMRDFEHMQHQLEEALHRYADLYDFAPVGYLTFDGAGMILEINLAGARMLGVGRSSLIGWPFAGWLMPEQRRVFFGHLKQTLLSDHAVVSELEIERGDRQRRCFRMESMRYNEGKVRSVITDITESRKLDRLRKQHEDQIARVAQVTALGEMASTLAHEMNQPICAIANYAQGLLRLLKLGLSSPEQMQFALEHINEQAQRAGETVRHIRDFSRKPQGTRSLVDVNKVIADSIDLVAPAARERAVAIEVALGEGLSPVFANPIQLEQVVVNLLLNGIESYDDQTSDRRVRVQAEKKDAKHTEVSVADRGQGIDRRDLSHLFEMFFTTKPSGTGIGLSVCRGIVESHGGRIWVTPNRGPGTTVHFSLPEAERPIEALQLRTGPEQPAEPGKS
jgi:two-component system sensor kinase FixL